MTGQPRVVHGFRLAGLALRDSNYRFFCISMESLETNSTQDNASQNAANAFGPSFQRRKKAAGYRTYRLFVQFWKAHP
jgi:hypothetical protein